MLKDEGPEVRSLALLIQLFGREVLDRLREAGFVSPLAIARAGPEMLAEQGDIALPLARRIVAVAMETEGIGELPDPEFRVADPSAVPDVESPGPSSTPARAAGTEADSPGAPPVAPDRRRRGDRSERARTAPRGGTRATKRRSTAAATPADGEVAGGPEGGPTPDGRAGDSTGTIADRPGGSDPVVEISGPDIEMSGDRGASPAAAGRPRSGSGVIDAAIDDSDPFVDDAALISWMGFNARTGIGRPNSIAVADEILDPALPAAPVPPVRPDSPAPATAAPDAADPGTAAPVQAPIRKPAIFTLSGSFWSFGRRRVPPADPGKDPADGR